MKAASHFDPTYLVHNNCEAIAQVMGESASGAKAYLQSTVIDRLTQILESVLVERPENVVCAVASQLRDSMRSQAVIEREVSIVYPPFYENASGDGANEASTVAPTVVRIRSTPRPPTSPAWRQVGALPLLGMLRPSLEELHAVLDHAKQLNYATVSFVFCRSSEALFLGGRLFLGDGVDQLSSRLGARVPFDDIEDRLQERLLDMRSRTADSVTLPHEAVAECGLKGQIPTTYDSLRLHRESATAYDTGDTLISASLLDDLNEIVLRRVASSEQRVAIVIVGCVQTGETLRRCLAAASTSLCALAKKQHAERLRRAESERIAKRAQQADEAHLEQRFHVLVERRRRFVERRHQREVIRTLRMSALAAEPDFDTAPWETAAAERKVRHARQDAEFDRLVGLERTRASVKIQALMRGFIARRRAERGKRMFTTGSGGALLKRKSSSSLMGEGAKDSNEPPAGIADANSVADPDTYFGVDAMYTAVRGAVQDVVFHYKEYFTSLPMRPPPQPHTATQWRHCVNRIASTVDADASSEDEFFEPVAVELKAREPLQPEHLLPNVHQLLLKCLEDSGYDERRFVYGARTLHHGFPAVQRRAFRAVEEMTLMLLNIGYFTLLLQEHHSTRGRSLSQWLDSRHSALMRQHRHQQFVASCTPPTGIPVSRISGPASFARDFATVDPIPVGQTSLSFPPWSDPQPSSAWESDLAAPTRTIGNHSRFVHPEVPVVLFAEPSSAVQMDEVVSALTEDGHWTAAVMFNSITEAVALVNGRPIVAANRIAPRSAMTQYFGNAEVAVVAKPPPTSSAANAAVGGGTGGVSLARTSTLHPRPPRDSSVSFAGNHSPLTVVNGQDASGGALTPRPPQLPRTLSASSQPAPTLGNDALSTVEDQAAPSNLQRPHRTASITVEAADMTERRWLGVSWLEMERKFAAFIRHLISSNNGVLHTYRLLPDGCLAASCEMMRVVRARQDDPTDAAARAKVELSEVVTKHMKRKTLAAMKHQRESDSLITTNGSGAPDSGVRSSSPSNGRSGSQDISTDAVGGYSAGTAQDASLNGLVKAYSDGCHSLVFLQRGLRMRTCRVPSFGGIDEFIEAISFIHRQVDDALKKNAKSTIICVGVSRPLDLTAGLAASVAVAVHRDVGYKLEQSVEAALERLRSPVSVSVHLTEDDDERSNGSAASGVGDEAAVVFSDEEDEGFGEDENGDGELHEEGTEAWLRGTGLVATVKSRAKSFATASGDQRRSRSGSERISGSGVAAASGDMLLPRQVTPRDISDVLAPPSCVIAFANDKSAELGRSGIKLIASARTVTALLVASRLHQSLLRPFDEMMIMNAEHHRGLRSESLAARRCAIRSGVRALQQYLILVVFHAFLNSSWHATLPALGFDDFMQRHPFLRTFLDAPDPFGGAAYCMDPYFGVYTHAASLWRATEFATTVA